MNIIISYDILHGIPIQWSSKISDNSLSANLKILYTFYSPLLFVFKLKFKQNFFKSKLQKSYLKIIQQLFINGIIMPEKHLHFRSLHSFILKHIPENIGYTGKYNVEMFKS